MPTFASIVAVGVPKPAAAPPAPVGPVGPTDPADPGEPVGPMEPVGPVGPVPPVSPLGRTNTKLEAPVVVSTTTSALGVEPDAMVAVVLAVNTFTPSS